MRILRDETAKVNLILDGGEEDHLLGDDQDSVTIHALVMDQGQNHLTGTEVTFAATSNPAGVFTSTRTEDRSRSNG